MIIRVNVDVISLIHLLTIHNSLEFDDDFRSGCRNVSQRHHNQDYNTLPTLDQSPKNPVFTTKYSYRVMA